MKDNKDSIFEEIELDSFKKETFKELFINPTNYRIIDGIVGIVFAVALFFGYFLLGNLFLFNKYNDISKIAIILLFELGVTLIIIIYIKIRKIPFSELGFRKKTSIYSLRYGLIWSAIIIALIIVIKLISNSISVEKNIEKIILYGVYYLITVGLFEEFIFRCFLNNILRGLFKNAIVTAIITAFLFSIMHLPFRIIPTNLSLLAFFKINWFEFVVLFLMHFFFQYFFYRYKNIIAPTIVHFVWDFGQWIL